MTIGNPEAELTFGRIKELSAVNADLFRQEARASVNVPKVIKVDLSQTTYMDCTGLGVLVALRNLARAHNSKVCLLNPTASVQRLFDIMHLAASFEIVHASTENHPQICESLVAQPGPRLSKTEISNADKELAGQPRLEREQNYDPAIDSVPNQVHAVTLDRSRPSATFPDPAHRAAPVSSSRGLLAQMISSVTRTSSLASPEAQPLANRRPARSPANDQSNSNAGRLPETTMTS